MPSPGISTTWGRESWAATLIQALSVESALMRSGVTRVIADGRVVHIPRIRTNPQSDWVAELEELPSDSGDADTVVLTPKKLGDVVSISREAIEDAAVAELDAVGQSMVRGVATKVDATAFSANAATATAPAGLLSGALPSGGTDISIEGVVGAVGVVQAAGGTPSAIYLNPAALTELRLAALTGGYLLTANPVAPGIEGIAGATFFPTPGIAPKKVLVADARYILVAVRRDAAVDFSQEALFTQDAVAARVTMRVDWELGDVNACALITAP